MTYIGTKNYALEIAKGNVSGSTLITKFGHNTDVDTGAAEDLWSQGGLYVAPTVARIHNITSTSVNDTSAGTGMRTVLIRGVNASYVATSETITMNGTSNVATVNSYLHIHLMQSQSAGSGGVNAGTITATAQTDATVTCSMAVGTGQSESAIYLVPTGYTAYIMKIRARMNNATANSAATVSLYTIPFGLALQLKTSIGINNSGSSFIELDYTASAPFVVPEKSWIKLRCDSVTNNNTDVQGEYDLILAG